MESVDYRFERLTDTQGFNPKTILSIHRDQTGFLWIGNYDGLSRYDGYEFKSYKKEPGNPSSISSNRVKVIFEDKDGQLWLGTDGGGLNFFQRKTETFIHYMHDPEDSTSLSSNRINSIYQDKLGYLWIATDFGGLDMLDPQTGLFTHYRHDAKNPYSISYDIVTGFIEEENGDLWIATFNGLNYFQRNTGRFIHYFLDSSKPEHYTMRSINRILRDRQGNFWIGTFEYGVAKYNKKTGDMIIYRHRKNDPNSLSNDIITALHEDRFGRIWIGTEEGLNLFDSEKNHFIRYTYNPQIPQSIGGNIVSTIAEDPLDIGDALWIGGDGIGLNRIRLEGKQFQLIRKDEAVANTLSSNNITALYEDPQESGRILWIGTKGGGLNRLDRVQNRYTYYRYDPVNPGTISNNFIRYLHKDHTGLLWVATDFGLSTLDEKTGEIHRFIVNQITPARLLGTANFVVLEDRDNEIWVGGWDIALAKYDRKKNSFKNYLPSKEDPYSIGSRIVWYIYEDPYEEEKILWIGTHDNGLNRFDPATERFLHFPYHEDDPSGICHSTVLSIHKAHIEDCLWIATSGGLDLFHTRDHTFTHMSDIDPLLSQPMQSILIDDSNQLWIGSTNGLIKFNPETKTCVLYNQRDGLQGEHFEVNTACKSSQGEMIIGGHNGFNVFYPDSIHNDHRQPNVVLTDFQIFNQSVPVSFEKESILKQSISETSEIILSYKQSVFSFEFAALHFASSSENQYAYRLAGFETDLNFTDASKRFATYTNLNPGEYTFEVKAANNDGVWTDQIISCKVIITPPFWRTLWFRVSAIFVFTALLALAYRMRTRAMTIRNEELESMNQQLNNEIEVRKDAESRISHELEEKRVLLKEVHHRVKNNLQVICSLLHLESRQIDKSNYMRVFQETENRIRSMALVHQKLYQSSTLAEIDIQGYLQDLIHNLCSIFKSFYNKIQVDVPDTNIQIAVDQAVPLGLIINEIVSNAIEHAFPGSLRENANIKIGFYEADDNHYELTVRDNGVGMPESIDMNNQHSLGLKLIKILCEDQLNGSVQIIRDKGTTFVITFPNMIHHS